LHDSYKYMNMHWLEVAGRHPLAHHRAPGRGGGIGTAGHRRRLTFKVKPAA